MKKLLNFTTRRFRKTSWEFNFAEAKKKLQRPNFEDFPSIREIREIFFPRKFFALSY